MKLLRSGDRYILECKFEEKEVAKAAGFRWDPSSRRWYTVDPARAAKVRQFADPSLQSELQIASQQADILEKDEARDRAESRALSVAIDSEVEFPCPEGRAYLPFQKAGIAYGSSRPNTLIGDDMGLGKTIQALGIINADPHCHRALVICPASLKINWEREATRWLVRPTRICVVDSKIKRLPAFTGDLLVIANYDIINKIRPILDHSEFGGGPWDILILDEAHYTKSPKAQRTTAIFGRRSDRYKKAVPPIDSRRVVALTGTPIPNRPIELWTLVHNLDPHGLGKSWFGFASRYCGAERTAYGWDASGSSNLDELQSRLRESILIRRLKSEVLTELPAKRRQVIELPLNGSAALVARQRAAYERNSNLLSELRAAVRVAEISDDVESYRNAVQALRSGASAGFAELSKLRHEVALSKVPHAVEHIQDAVESSGSVVVFAHHKDVVSQIAEALQDRGIRVATLTGDHDLNTRQAAVDGFQAGEFEVIILTIGAGGVGITLTRSAHVIFVELDWVPGSLTQAEDRCHRIGQAGSVLVQHVVLEGSLDAYIAQTVVAKQEVIERALDGGGSSEGSEEAPLDAVSLALAALAESEGRQSAKSQQRAAEQAAAAIVSESDRRLIHDAVRVIASRCDGARELDGQGFNATDTEFGKRLAGQADLVGRQVIYARKLALKYGRQIDQDLRSAIKAIELQLPADSVDA